MLTWEEDVEATHSANGFDPINRGGSLVGVAGCVGTLVGIAAWCVAWIVVTMK